MEVDVQFLPMGPASEFLSSRAVVVIDVLRATSVIVHAISRGAMAFHAVSSAREILVGSFLNVGATARRCLEMGKDLLLFPSGDEGNFSLEDAVCGGMVIDQLIHQDVDSIHLTDAASAAYFLYQQLDQNLLEVFHISHDGKELVNKGLE